MRSVDEGSLPVLARLFFFFFPVSVLQMDGGGYCFSELSSYHQFQTSKFSMTLQEP